MWTEWKGGSVSESAQAIFILYSLRKQKPKPKQAHKLKYSIQHATYSSRKSWKKIQFWQLLVKWNCVYANIFSFLLFFFYFVLTNNNKTKQNSYVNCYKTYVHNVKLLSLHSKQHARKMCNKWINSYIQLHWYRSYEFQWHYYTKLLSFLDTKFPDAILCTQNSFDVVSSMEICCLPDNL